MVKTAQTAQPSDKISTYVAVISFLNGIGAVIGMLGFGSVPSVLSSLCNAVACICFAVFLFQYRDKMRALMADCLKAQPAPLHKLPCAGTFPQRPLRFFAARRRAIC